LYRYSTDIKHHQKTRKQIKHFLVGVRRENVCVHINETTEELTNHDRFQRLSYERNCNETSYDQYTCVTVLVFIYYLTCQTPSKRRSDGQRDKPLFPSVSCVCQPQGRPWGNEARCFIEK